MDKNKPAETMLTSTCPAVRQLVRNTMYYAMAGQPDRGRWSHRVLRRLGLTE